jgi:uncharacterized membrane protein
MVIGGERYHSILVPSAPVPVGGALVYVPVSWIKRADMGVEELMTIYVSMGVSGPRKPPAAIEAQDHAGPPLPLEKVTLKP